MKEKLAREVIAMRIAKEFFDGAIVNLGIGIPTLVSSFVPEGMQIIYHTENGALGFGPVVRQDELNEKADIDFTNAGGQYLLPKPGMCFFDSAASFDMIRGGHIDLAVLGAYQVSQSGDLANWGRPGRPATGMGGAMDLATGCRKLIVMMMHTTKEGEPRIVKKCSFPLTALNCVDRIFTDIAVIDVTQNGLILSEVAPEWTADEVQAHTEAPLVVSEDLKVIEL